MERASSSLFAGTSGPFTPAEPNWGHNIEEGATFPKTSEKAPKPPSSGGHVGDYLLWCLGWPIITNTRLTFVPIRAAMKDDRLWPRGVIPPSTVRGRCSQQVWLFLVLDGSSQAWPLETREREENILIIQLFFFRFDEKWNKQYKYTSITL